MTKQNNMTADERYCYDCIHNEVCRYCPHDGCEFKETLKEAKPVKHGRWIEQEHVFGSTLLRYYECSECHVKVLGGERMEFLYCPMCSCRMDGGIDG